MPRPPSTLPQRNTDRVGQWSDEVAAELRARLGIRNGCGQRPRWNPNGGWRVLLGQGWGVLMKTKSELSRMRQSGRVDRCSGAAARQHGNHASKKQTGGRPMKKQPSYLAVSVAISAVVAIGATLAA